jgi:hypothetical protein
MILSADETVVKDRPANPFVPPFATRCTLETVVRDSQRFRLLQCYTNDRFGE